MRPNRQGETHALPSTIISILLACVFIHQGIAFGPAAQVKKVATPHLAASLSRPSPILSASNRRQRRPSKQKAIPTVIAYSPNADLGDVQQSPRSKFRRLTGFSFSALRSTLRAATGFSLTTFRATLRAATGISLSGLISGSLRRILDILSPSLRYFMQPFLIVYYAPLLMVRYWLVGPSKQYVEESRKGHEKLIEGWRKAVQAAEKANSDRYWPVHLKGVSCIAKSLE